MTNFIKKIKATKRIANEKMFNWYNCLFQGLLLILCVSLAMTVFTVNYSSVEFNNAMLLGLPIIYAVILTYFFLEKIIILHILLFEKLNKMVFTGWQKFDMWYYRKYRKTSPLTENLAKFQHKASKYKISKMKRRVIIMTLIGLAIMINFLPIIFDSPEIKQDIPEVEKPQELQPQIIVRGGG